MTSPRMTFLTGLCLLVAFALGCEGGSDDIQTYSAPKEPPTVRPVEWATPQGWRELRPQEMQYAAFAVDEKDADASLSVLALPRESNELAPNVNRWERQLGLPPSPADAVERMVSHVDVNGAHADVVDLTGTDAVNGTGAPRRMLAAVVPHGTMTWFFTLKGRPETVERQKGNFDAFVRSLKFRPDPDAPADDHSHVQNVAAQAQKDGHHPNDGHDHTGHDHGPAEPAATKVNWGALPTGWAEDPGERPMRVHTLLVEANGAKGEAIVTRFPQNAVGDLLSNLNRWRGQVGLEPTTDAKGHAPRELSMFGGPGAAFDMEGPAKDGQPARRQIVAMTAQGGNFWFVRFIGPKELVDGQQKAFEKMLADARFVGAAQTSRPTSQTAPSAPQQTSPSTQPSGSSR